MDISTSDNFIIQGEHSKLPPKHWCLLAVFALYTLFDTAHAKKLVSIYFSLSKHAKGHAYSSHASYFIAKVFKKKKKAKHASPHKQSIFVKYIFFVRIRNESLKIQKKK